VVAGHTRVDELTRARVDDGVAGDATPHRADHAVVGVAVARDTLEGGTVGEVTRVEVDVHGKFPYECIVGLGRVSVKRPYRNRCESGTQPRTQAHQRRTRRPGSQRRSRCSVARGGSSRRSSRIGCRCLARSSCTYSRVSVVRLQG